MERRVFERITLIDQIVNDIKGRIISREFKEGDLLPSQDEMARRLGVSRVSLREAFNRLALMGLIEIRHGVGSYIKATKPEYLINSISSMIVMDQTSADELLQARQLIEPMVAALAAKNATRDDLEKIRDVLEAMDDEFRSGLIENYKEKDTQFHMLVASSSQNRVLLRVVLFIRDLLPNVIYRAFGGSQTLQASAIKFHRQIYEAIRRQDSEAARREMENHLMSLKDLQKQFFDWKPE
jgi:GntR family transcriptional repressor for pyruvate dehydrogenase complex